MIKLYDMDYEELRYISWDDEAIIREYFRKRDWDRHKGGIVLAVVGEDLERHSPKNDKTKEGE